MIATCKILALIGNEKSSERGADDDEEEEEEEEEVVVESSEPGSAMKEREVCKTRQRQGPEGRKLAR